jgi:hypothetical protein
MQSSDHGVSAARRTRHERQARESVATHRDLFVPEEQRRCDLCDAIIEGEDGGSGLYVWSRGDVVRYEEPPLCPTCGPRLAITAIRQWEEEDEEGGE